MDIEKLIKDFPNDSELGYKIRELYMVNKDNLDIIEVETENVKIFESPDKGKTVYVRMFGEDITQRKLVTNKTELFNEVN
jgi:hypothetical protein